MEAQYGKFLDMIRAVRINVPLVDVLAGMSNYGKFLKELVSNKHKLEQISAAFLSDESCVLIQNKVPPKLGDPRSFLTPCNFDKAFSCDALADLGASINLMPYSLFAKLSLETLKPTKMSVRLADSIDVIDEILEEDFDALLDEGSKILYSIEGTILEEKLFAEFNEFMCWIKSLLDAVGITAAQVYVNTTLMKLVGGKSEAYFASLMSKTLMLRESAAYLMVNCVVLRVLIVLHLLDLKCGVLG
nr:reverse transcriptase domain-containing protein [Tanacetum cinerariifolium]